jgi:UDP-glucose:(heptosyl)LPS alpha-1,3-glucosyltransferase
MRIANECFARGHSIHVYVMSWRGEGAPDFDVHILDAKGLSNHAKVGHFHQQLSVELKQEKYDCVVGFNKMPMLDVYFAADTCYVERFEKASFWKKLNPRYRFYSGAEAAVFGDESETICMMISDIQVEQFRKYYGVQDKRLAMLPPGIDLGRRRPENWMHMRKKFRDEHGLKDDDLLILMVGTGFKTKGVDRAIKAIASLPTPYRAQACLMVVGEGDSHAYMRLAHNQGVANRVYFMGGRNDVPDFLLGADLLLHPSRKESAGMVILEAIVAGLPVLVSGVCGYAKHVKNSKAGTVLEEPFLQESLNENLFKMMSSDKQSWTQNALSYADSEDLYSLPEKAADIIEQVARNKECL